MATRTTGAKSKANGSKVATSVPSIGLYDVVVLPVPWTAVRSLLGSRVHARLDVAVDLSNGPGRRAWKRAAGHLVCEPRGWRGVKTSHSPLDCPKCLKEIARRWPSGREQP